MFALPVSKLSVQKGWTETIIKFTQLCETRWTDSGQLKLSTGETLLYSGHQEDGAPHTEGVGFMISKSAVKSMIEWKAISSRIITARFFTKLRTVFMVQCYAPTNDTEEQTKIEFYQQLQDVIDHKKKKDILILMGDPKCKDRK